MRDDRVTLSRREYEELRLRAAAAGKLPSGLLTVQEISLYTRLSPSAVRRLIKSGRLQSVRLDSRALRVVVPRAAGARAQRPGGIW